LNAIKLRGLYFAEKGKELEKEIAKSQMITMIAWGQLAKGLVG